MSRETILNEATSKMIELESILNADAFGKTDYGVKRAQVLFNELTDLRYSNSMCGEHTMQKWMSKLRNRFAENFINKE
jgi:hypothetical protein